MDRTYRDLPAALHVATTREDLREAEPGQGAFCVLARAAKRALGLPLDSTDVSFDGMGILTIWQGAETRDYDLGPESQNYSERFDLSWPLEPAAFAGVLLPKPSQRKAA